MNELSKEQLSEIESAIYTRIQEHEDKHEGLYTDEELEVLRPIWRANIIKDIQEIVGYLPELQP